MKKIFLVMLLGCFWGGVFGQVMFQKTYGTIYDDVGYSLKQTSDKGYIVCGSSNYSPYLLKLDSLGNIEWTKIFSTLDTKSAYSVDQTYDGGYIVIGSWGPNLFYLELYRVDATGNIIWTKQFSGGVGNPYILGYSVHQTLDSGFVIAGTTYNVMDVILVKTDLNGNVQWSKNYRNNVQQNYGYDVKLTSDGGFIIVGETTTPVFSNAYHNDVYMIRTNSYGDTLWTKNYSFTFSGSPAYDNEGKGVQQTSDGGFIICGRTWRSGNYFNNAFLLKTDSIGNVIWSKTYGNINSYFLVNSVSQISSGGYIIEGEYGGNFGSYPSLIRTNSIGDTLWTRKYGVQYSSYKGATSCLQTSDHGYIFECGINFNSNYDLYITKTDSLGNSDCAQSNLGMTISVPIVNQSFQTTQVLSFGITVSNPTVNISSDGAITGDCLTVSIPEINNHQSTIEISPNPFTSTTTLTFSEAPKNASLKVMNILGEVVFQSEIHTPKSEINLSNQPNGMYFVNVQTEKGMVSRKVIKQ